MHVTVKQGMGEIQMSAADDMTMGGYSCVLMPRVLWHTVCQWLSMSVMAKQMLLVDRGFVRGHAWRQLCGLVGQLGSESLKTPRSNRFTCLGDLGACAPRQCWLCSLYGKLLCMPLYW